MNPLSLHMQHRQDSAVSLEDDDSNISVIINELNSSNKFISSLVIDLDKIKRNDKRNFIEAAVFLFSNIFEQLSELNHRLSYPQALIDSLNDTVKLTLSQIDDCEKDHFASSLLDSIVAHPFSQSDSILITILEDIIERHQNALSNLIYTKISCGIILPLQALQYIHDRFEASRKSKNKFINYLALDSFKELQEALNELKTKVDNAQTSFLVRHHESAHVSPVFVEKTGTHYKFFISDSLGHFIDKEGKTPRFTKEMIKNISFFMNDQNVTIYASKKQRQRDHTNCTIFSLIDSKKNFSTSELFKQLEQNSTLEAFNAESELSPIDVHWVEKLPFKLELTNQSLKQIKECAQALNPGEEKAYKQRKLEKIQQKYTWYVPVPDSTDYREKIAQSSYIVIKRNHLIKMIVDKALKK